MTYRESLKLLNARGNEVQGIHLGLGRIRATLRPLGNPQLSFPSLHIAGTNGKGSVAAMAESILREAGYRTGLYTSPHLVRLEERIRVRGRMVTRDQLARLLSEVIEVESALLATGDLDRPLTYFELITVAAFLHFAERRIEVAVVEVGLGGRLDATNVVVPCACAITGISYDHQELLGRTLGKIAGEKAGIIKPGTPVISGCRSSEARSIIGRVARRNGSPLFEIGRDYRVRNVRERRWGVSFDLETPREILPNLSPALAGLHQAHNAALAVALLELSDLFPVTRAQIRKGLTKARWPGRLEEFRAPRRTILDGAHNTEGATILAAHLKRLGAKDVRLVFAALRDKDIRGMTRRLFPIARRIYLAPLSNTRAADPCAILALAPPRVSKRIGIHPDARGALKQAWRESPRDGVVVAAGSLYLVGELLPLVRTRTRRDVPVASRPATTHSSMRVESAARRDAL